MLAIDFLRRYDGNSVLFISLPLAIVASAVFFVSYFSADSPLRKCLIPYSVHVGCLELKDIIYSTAGVQNIYLLRFNNICGNFFQNGNEEGKLF